MKHFLKFETKLFFMSPKHLLLVLFFVAFLGFTYIMIPITGIGNMEQEIHEEVTTNTMVTTSFNQSNLEEQVSDELYENVLRQQQLNNIQNMGFIVEEDEWYLDASIELAELRIEMMQFDLSAFPDLLMPTEHQLRSNLALYQELREESTPLMTERTNGAGYLMTLLEFLGVGAFFFILFVGSSILTSDQQHGSMVLSYPLTLPKRLVGKSMIYIVGTFLATALLVLIGVGTVSLLTSPGLFSYPMRYFGSSGYSTLPLLRYAGMFLFYYFFLTLHTILLTACLNVALKNEYATLFTGAGLFILPNLFPFISERLYWLPMNFYNITRVFTGETASLAGHSAITPVYGLFILTIWSLVFVGLVSLYAYLSNQKQTVTSSEEQLSVSE